MLRKKVIEQRIESEIAALDLKIHDALESVKNMERERESLQRLLHEAAPKTARARKPSRETNPHDEVYYGKEGNVETLGDQLDAGATGGN